MGNKMREIKFRAWHKEEKFMSNPFSIFEITDGFVDFGQFIYGYENDVILFQFTGLKDSKGVEIYEGYIVEMNVETDDQQYEFTGEVKWRFNGLVVEDKTNNVNWAGIGPALDTSVEVIGNIMENPELLKGGEKYDRKRQIKKKS